MSRGRGTTTLAPSLADADEREVARQPRRRHPSSALVHTRLADAWLSRCTRLLMAWSITPVVAAVA